MPRLMMLCGGRPAISRALELDRARASGASVPDSMLKIVLLPEPFGPIRPRISPCSTLNDTLLTAVKPPKRLTNPLDDQHCRYPIRLLAHDPVGQPVHVMLYWLLNVDALRQRQHGFALRLALRPHHVRLVVDILDDDRERALVLAGHRRALAGNLTPKPSMVPPSGRSTSSAALRSASGSTPPYFLMARGSTSVRNT